MSGKRVLIVLGGDWHDFDGFAAAMQPIFESAGYTVASTYDLGVLKRLEDSCDVVLLYTCLGGQRQDGQSATPGPTDELATALVNWVRAGGGLLAAHAATVMGQSSPVLRALMGGAFVSHPPPFAFTIYPLYGRHPITAGIEAFTVHDELYIEEYDASVNVHMVALERGVAHPMVWSRFEGKGRVAHIALGHDHRVWYFQSYRQLMLQALHWLAA